MASAPAITKATTERHVVTLILSKVFIDMFNGDPSAGKMSLNTAEVGDRVGGCSAHVYVSALGQVEVGGTVGEICSWAADEHYVVGVHPGARCSIGYCCGAVGMADHGYVRR